MLVCSTVPVGSCCTHQIGIFLDFVFLRLQRPFLFVVGRGGDVDVAQVQRPEQRVKPRTQLVPDLRREQWRHRLYDGR